MGIRFIAQRPSQSSAYAACQTSEAIVASGAPLGLALQFLVSLNTRLGKGLGQYDRPGAAPLTR